MFTTVANISTHLDALIGKFAWDKGHNSKTCRFHCIVRAS